MKKKIIPWMLTPLPAGSKCKWVQQVPLHEIRTFLADTGKACRQFSSIVAKVNDDHCDQTGIYYVGHYSRKKKAVSVYAMTIKEYEGYEGDPAQIRAWQSYIPEDYR